MNEQTTTPGDDHEAGVEPVAIVGLACRLPGAGDVRRFWRNLAEGVEGVRFYSRDEQAALGVPDYMLDDPSFVPAASILDEYAAFDAAFFGMSPREATLRDPQHRIFLELAYTALEDAGYDPARYGGEIGVYGAVGADEYQWLYVRRNPEVYGSVGFVTAIVGNHPDYLATLASYKLDLRGPSVTLHAACSTSLVAVHVACEALRSGECDLALTGGVSMEMPPEWGYMYTPDGIYSPDGHCRAFDARAAGTVWGSGGAMAVLKRLSDAVADGDHIRAVVLGNAINNDGASKVGFSAPSAEGQAAVVEQALGVAGVDPRTVTYVEAHGTGTTVGDPIEVAALSSVFGRDTDDRGWCGIGSVKTNVGHLGPAAGIAGLTKAVLALEHGLIPPSLNFETPNPKIDFAQSPFHVTAAPTVWETNGVPRRAGVSSFGIGGTNAHAVLEEAPRVERSRPPARPAHLLQLSARTPTALTASVERLGAHLAEHPDLDLADVAYTLRVGRRELPHRAGIVARDTADAAAALADPERLVAGRAQGRAPRVALLFTGQGAQYAGMGAGLYGAEPVFRDAVDACAEILSGELGEDLRELLLAGPDAEARGVADERLSQTALTQPALFTVEYALAQQWLAAGVEPAGMIGHSIGEFVAATLAGVFTLPDALRLVAARGRLMQSMPPGSMLAVRLDEDAVRDVLPAGLALAAVNAPGGCVVSGPTAQVDELAVRLEDDGVGIARLRTSHAFHSPMMEPILGEFRALVAAVPRTAPARPFLSNLTGNWIQADEATDPSYWARHLRETVRFRDCVWTLLSQGEWALVECGPGRQLCGLVRLQQPSDAPPPLPSLPGPGDDRFDVEVLLGAAAGLWVSGAPVDTRSLGVRAYRVPLPTYPWERGRHWFDTPVDPALVYQPPVQSGQLPVEDWFSVPVWSQEPPLPPRAAPFDRVLAFVDDAAGADLAAALRDAGVSVTEVWPDGAAADGRRTVRPAVREDYAALIAEQGLPARIVHAWSLAAAPAETPQAAWEAQDGGFFSLLCLVQALAATQPERAVHIDVLSAGTHAVTGADLVRPEHATLAGIPKVVPLEAPWLSVRHIDADPAGGEATAVLRELFADWAPPPTTEPVEAVALRAGRRWRQRYEPVRLPAAEPPLRRRGAYLITGGLGGIGITLADELARRYEARLVLVSRTGLPPREEWDGRNGDDRTARAIAAVRRMEASGAEVLVLAADVTSGADLARVREETLARFGRLDGILHAAGVPGGGMAEVKERAAAEAVLRPKLLGTLALREAFGDLELDFVQLCSSVTAVAGGFGQVDYCGANAFLDAHAAGAHGWRAPVVSVNWGGWAEVGMAAEVSAPTGFRALQRGDRMQPLDHPILTGQHVDGGQVLPWFSAVVSPDTHWLLDEHRIAGVPVMPGTGYVEAARSAFEAAVPRPGDEWALELRDLAFVAPMPVADGASAELRVLLSPGTDGIEFEVVTMTGEEPEVHARGTAAWVQPSPAPVVDIAAVRERCSLTVREDPAELSWSGSGLLDFGSRWRSLRRVHVGQDEELAELEAPPVVAAENGRFGLHPALLDEATAFAHAAPGGHSYLPLGYGRLLVRRPLPDRLWSHVQHRDGGGDEVVSTDLALFDADGREVVRISDFVLRRVDPDAVASTVDAGARATTEQAPVPEDSAAASVAATPDAPTDAIRPADGVDAFRRLLSTDLGSRIVCISIPLERFVASQRELTQETVEEELDPTAAAGRPAREASGDRVAPRTEVEAMLATLWAEVLGVDAVGVEDSFFDLGGNSLVAVQLMALTRKRVGVRLPMRSLFELPTVAGMAALVEELRGEDEAPRSSSIPKLAREPRRVREEETA